MGLNRNEPRVTLVSHTLLPMELVYCLWEASRTNNKLLVPDLIWNREQEDPGFKQEVKNLFRKVITSDIPIAENIDFVFVLENVSISFREQMVRHRIGVHVGDRLGVDIVPDLADSSWWSQSMRIIDMGTFATEGKFRIPDSIMEHPELVQKFIQTMYDLEATYKQLTNLGVPAEDAREIIPLAATHRISWKVNLAALQHIIGKRACWILQFGLWEPIIVGMVNELCDIVDPAFRELVAPPCMKEGKFIGCKYCLDNERRANKEDPYTPCPLWLENAHENQTTTGAWTKSLSGWDSGNQKIQSEFKERAERYQELWGIDLPQIAPVVI